MRQLLKKISHSAKETEQIGSALAGILKPGEVVGLYGPVGAGKTCLVRGLAAGFECQQPVKSPSFSLINEYPGSTPLIHLDLYRLASDAAIEDLGWSDYLETGAVMVIEWAERIKNLLPERTVDIYLSILDENSRELEIFVSDDFGDRQFR